MPRWLAIFEDGATRDEARTHADPFAIHGMWSGHRIHAWSKASFYGEVIL